MDKPQDKDASARARRAALIRHAFGDTVEATRAAREGFLARFERMVDPDGVMSAEERTVRGERLMKAHMTNLGLKSVRARRARVKKST